MSYKLQVKLPNGQYKSLDISKSDRLNLSDLYADYSNGKHYKITKGTFEMRDEFERISKKLTSDELKSKNREHTPKYSLKTLDFFTSQFEDEWSLKLHLVNCGILAPELINYPLVIRYITEKKVRKNYQILYLGDQYYFGSNINFVDKTSYSILIEIIENRYLNKDFQFLKALAQHFLNFRECQTTAAELLAAINETETTGYISNGFKEKDSNGDTVITRLPKLLIYKYDIKSNGDPQYRAKDKNGKNWRTFHLLTEFIRDYEQRELEETMSSSNMPHQEDVKKKAREPKAEKNPVLDGQISFKDLPYY